MLDKCGFKHLQISRMCPRFIAVLSGFVYPPILICVQTERNQVSNPHSSSAVQPVVAIWCMCMLLAICCYVHWSALIRPNKMQQYAGIYLLNHSTCFGCPSHPSSGVHKAVTAASGTGHSICAKTYLRRGLIRPRRRKVFAQIL